MLARSLLLAVLAGALLATATVAPAGAQPAEGKGPPARRGPGSPGQQALEGPSPAAAAAGGRTEAPDRKAAASQGVAARRQALKERWDELRRTRDVRRTDRRARIAGRFGDLSQRPAAIVELRIHARRMARLRRAQDVAEAAGKPELAERAQQLIARERHRHQQRMGRLVGESAGARAASPGSAPPSPPPPPPSAGAPPPPNPEEKNR